MAGCRTDIDWAAKSEPWCWIGPALRAEAERILAAPPSFATRLRAARKNHQLTQVALGRLIGRDWEIINRIENDVVDPTAEVRERLCAVLGIEE